MKKNQLEEKRKVLEEKERTKRMSLRLVDQLAYVALHLMNNAYSNLKFTASRIRLCI